MSNAASCLCHFCKAATWEHDLNMHREKQVSNCAHEWTLGREMALHDLIILVLIHSLVTLVTKGTKCKPRVSPVFVLLKEASLTNPTDTSRFHAGCLACRYARSTIHTCGLKVWWMHGFVVRWYTLGSDASFIVSKEWWCQHQTETVSAE